MFSLEPVPATNTFRVHPGWCETAFNLFVRWACQLYTICKRQNREPQYILFAIDYLRVKIDECITHTKSGDFDSFTTEAWVLVMTPDTTLPYQSVTVPFEVSRLSDLGTSSDQPIDLTSSGSRRMPFPWGQQTASQLAAQQQQARQAEHDRQWQQAAGTSRQYMSEDFRTGQGIGLFDPPLSHRQALLEEEGFQQVPP